MKTLKIVATTIVVLLLIATVINGQGTRDEVIDLGRRIAELEDRVDSNEDQHDAFREIFELQGRQIVTLCQDLNDYTFEVC